MSTFLKYTVCTATLLLVIACGQTTPQVSDTYTLKTANDKFLPVTLLDTIINEPETPPYRFTIAVVNGSLKLEGNQYTQSVRFASAVNGSVSSNTTWNEFGACTAEGEKFVCESNYIQNYRFELVKQGKTLVTKQHFGDPVLEGTYVFEQ
jgi:hypothetical protein